MDIYTLLGAFWAEHERAHFSKSAIVLYFRLLYEANRSFWQGPLVLSWEYLGRVLGFSPATLGRAISDLKSRGLIVYERKGKHSIFWFPDHFNNRSEKEDHFNYCSGNDSNLTDHFNNCSGNDSENDSEKCSENCSENRSKYIKTIRQEDYKTVRQEDKEKNINSKSPYGDLRTDVRELPLPEMVPSWYVSLNEYQKEIIDLWQTLIGPWEEEWLKDLDNVLKVCYPAQVKQAIQAMALTRPTVLMNRGFPYLVTPLINGAFGRKRSKKAQSKKKTWADEALKGVREWLKQKGEGINGEDTLW